MPHRLRSNFERGSSRWAVRRAQWRALGLTDEDMAKPKIAVVNSSSELAICFSHLDGVAAAVKEAVRAAGGVPFEVRTTAPSDFITSAGKRGGFILSGRDLITNDIEAQVEGAQLDGMVLLASCDKTTPGQIMAAARLDIPSIVVVCGYQPSGTLDGEPVDIEEVFLAAGHALLGKISVDRLQAMSEHAIGGPGVCSGMGTANSMHIACEALGMALPGSAPVLANSPKMFAQARSAGERIVAMVWEGLKPRAILTPGAFANAVSAVLAVSGSINCIKHLQAIATEAGCGADVFALVALLSAEVPVLAAVRPNGPDSIEAFEAAGGAAAVLKRIEARLDGAAPTVTGKTVAENLRDVTPTDDEVIRPADRPFSTRPPIVILHGSLAPESAIVKLGLVAGRRLRFEGRAIVYEDADAAMEAVRAGAVEPGHVLVLRGVGLKGGPGMSTASRVVFAVDGAGLETEVAIVTDGQLSGLVNRGLVVGEVCPEAATGGPLALVEDGDRIVIDVEKRAVDLDVPATVLAERRRRLGNRAPKPADGWLRIYRQTVGPMAKGAVLGGDG